MNSIPRTVGLLALAGILLSPLHAGAQILLYPLARAFGCPPESEFVKCREAFGKLQGDFATSRVAVQPVLVRPGATSVEDQNAWRPGLAANLINAIRREGGRDYGLGLEERVVVTTVGPTPMGRNQLRYHWSRAMVYADCVRAAHPPGEYFLFAEILGHQGRVDAIHVFIFNASGQLAYCRLFNSHHFGENLTYAGDAAVRLIARHLLEDLSKQPQQVFPPYGVG